MSNEQTPAPVEVPAPKSNPPPAPRNPWEIVAGTIVDLLAIGGTLFLASGGKISGEAALAVVALLAGVRLSDLVGVRNAAKGSGLAVLILSALHAHGGHAAIVLGSLAAVVAGT